eukprot:TRINITY_DN5742_c0_g1_i1.p1 TRINITY_DN5742_c0_g1~~TRINITY_DN5742_c0_g1_i1.p1  ORF type:complete len:319 (-),score=40.67 TRINITY_DN5742_c0_g1_i1:17-973(-)
MSHGRSSCSPVCSMSTQGFLSFSVLIILISAFGEASMHEKRCKRAGCVLQNEASQGPYYYDTELIRSNITEDVVGIPLVLQFSVIDVHTCEKITGAAIDVWHADPLGIYSHFQTSDNPGGAIKTYLRGIVISDQDGNATFTTVLPGWFSGRTVHIHVKVYLNGVVHSGATPTYTDATLIHTGQVFLDQVIMDQYMNVAPYSSNTQSRTMLVDDTGYQQAGDNSVLLASVINGTSGIAGGVMASINLVVDSSYGRTANPSNNSSAMALGIVILIIVIVGGGIGLAVYLKKRRDAVKSRQTRANNVEMDGRNVHIQLEEE